MEDQTENEIESGFGDTGITPSPLNTTVGAEKGPPNYS